MPQIYEIFFIAVVVKNFLQKKRNACFFRFAPVMHPLLFLYRMGRSL